jgi:hypothetical protein
MEKTGRALDGSASENKVISLYRAVLSSLSTDVDLSIVENKNGNQSIIIFISKYPMMKVRSSMPNEDGGIHLISLEYLGGNTHGWNEFSMGLIGTGTFVLEETPHLKLNNDIEPVQITAGRIHRYESRIVGDEALTNLRNRWERIAVTVEWMLSREDVPYFQNISDFDKYWKPILFPEQVRKKNRPQGWQQEGDIFQREEDIRWNTGYTERILPEDLWAVRNSGTLLRDWEEALQWIYMEYNWKSITDLLSCDIILNKIK